MIYESDRVAALQQAVIAGRGTPCNDDNSQIVGSDVLIYTDCNCTMFLSLLFPPRDDKFCGPKEYVVHPSFSFPLMHGTLFVFKAADDLLFYHACAFEPRVTAGSFRFALVYRWLASKRDFFVGSWTMKVTQEVRDKQEKKKRAASAAKSKQQKQTLQGPFA